VRLILVEDEPFIALDLEMLVLAAGHSVVGVADTFDTAVALARAQRPDAALVDLNLSDGPTGPAVARTFVEQLGLAVGFVTGNPDQLPKDFDGAVGVLDKPFIDQGVLEMLDMLQGQGPDARRFVRPVNAH
jgi:CheY-like chemotaxis protein